MLVSLSKNPWLWSWVYEKIELKDPEYKDYLIHAFAKTRPEEIKGRYLMRLEEFGYKVKLTRTGKDALISMTEEEYVFLKLKYS
jgi:hypothetical protein